jgi:hypothetical protein
VLLREYLPQVISERSSEDGISQYAFTKAHGIYDAWNQ